VTQTCSVGVAATEAHALEPAVAGARLWLHELMTKLELSPEEAGRGLHALPVLVRGLFDEGWWLTNDPERICNRE